MEIKKSGVMPSLDISLAPMPLDFGDDEEKAAFGLLKVIASNQILTEGKETNGDDVIYRPGPYVSGYHLAEWIVWNWWRLRWEPCSAYQNPGHRDWGFAHRISSVGQGYVWPNITVFADGFWTGLVAERSSVSDASNFRYIGAKPISIPAREWETAVDDFVGFVVRLTDDAGLSDTNLHLLWQGLQLERKDPEMTRFRRFEALLGSDPNELDGEEIESRLEDARVLGEKALEEIAIGSAAIDANLSGMPSAKEIAEITKRAGFGINPDDGASINIPELSQWGNQAAWRIGTRAANALRSQERLGDEPITNTVLADLAGTTADVIRADNSSGEFSWVFQPDGASAHVALRSIWKTGRRFELARLLGDRIFADSLPGGPEPLSPATRAYSYRQKAQRAFAAELLSPWAAVKEMLGKDYSVENQELAAERFSVSAMTINTLLRNNAEISADDRMLFRY